MKKILVVCVAALAVLGCGKDKFKTEPQVEVQGLGPNEVTKGNVFTFRAIVRDKEGDLQDSVLLVRKRFNGTTLAGNPDTLRYSLKAFALPDKTRIEIAATFSYGELRDNYIFQNLEAQDRNLSIGIIVRDKAGHRSNYDESKMILLKRL